MTFLICKCPILTSVNWAWFGWRATLNYWRPTDSPARLKRCFILMFVSVTNYIGLHVGAKLPVFHLSPRYGQVIFVSGCLLFNLYSSYNWQVRVNICARSNVTFDIGSHVVMYGRAGVAYVGYVELFGKIRRSWIICFNQLLCLVFCMVYRCTEPLLLILTTYSTFYIEAINAGIYWGNWIYGTFSKDQIAVPLERQRIRPLWRFYQKEISPITR